MHIQGRRRVLKSGPAKTRSSVACTRGGEHERGVPPSRKGGWGDLPRENFDLLVLLNVLFASLSSNFTSFCCQNDRYFNII